MSWNNLQQALELYDATKPSSSAAPHDTIYSDSMLDVFPGWKTFSANEKTTFTAEAKQALKTLDDNALLTLENLQLIQRNVAAIPEWFIVFNKIYYLLNTNGYTSDLNILKTLIIHPNLYQIFILVQLFKQNSAFDSVDLTYHIPQRFGMIDMDLSRYSIEGIESVTRETVTRFRGNIPKLLPLANSIIAIFNPRPIHEYSLDNFDLLWSSEFSDLVQQYQLLSEEYSNAAKQVFNVKGFSKYLDNALKQLKNNGYLTRANIIAILSTTCDSYLTAATALIALKHSGCLTPRNRNAVVAHTNPQAAANALIKLKNANCLTPANKVAVLAHINPVAVANALIKLKNANCLTPANRVTVVTMSVREKYDPIDRCIYVDINTPEEIATTIINGTNPVAIPEINIITPAERAAIIAKPDIISDVISILQLLEACHLLTRANYRYMRVSQELGYLTQISTILDILKSYGLSTQDNFAIIARADAPWNLANILELLNELGHLTPDRIHTILVNTHSEHLTLEHCKLLEYLSDSGYLSSNNVDTVINHPNPRAAIEALTPFINAGFATQVYCDEILRAADAKATTNQCIQRITTSCVQAAIATYDEHKSSLRTYLLGDPTVIQRIRKLDWQKARFIDIYQCFIGKIPKKYQATYGIYYSLIQATFPELAASKQGRIADVTFKYLNLILHYLNDAGLLTEKNIDIVRAHTTCLLHFAITLKILKNSNLLTQANFDATIGCNLRHADKALSQFNVRGDITQTEYDTYVIHATAETEQAIRQQYRLMYDLHRVLEIPYDTGRHYLLGDLPAIKKLKKLQPKELNDPWKVFQCFYRHLSKSESYTFYLHFIFNTNFNQHIQNETAVRVLQNLVKRGILKEANFKIITNFLATVEAAQILDDAGLLTCQTFDTHAIHATDSSNQTLKTTYQVAIEIRLALKDYDQQRGFWRKWLRLDPPAIRQLRKLKPEEQNNPWKLFQYVGFQIVKSKSAKFLLSHVLSIILRVNDSTTTEKILSILATLSTTNLLTETSFNRVCQYQGDLDQFNLVLSALADGNMLTEATLNTVWQYQGNVDEFYSILFDLDRRGMLTEAILHLVCLYRGNRVIPIIQSLNDHCILTDMIFEAIHHYLNNKTNAKKALETIATALIILKKGELLFSNYIAIMSQCYDPIHMANALVILKKNHLLSKEYIDIANISLRPARTASALKVLQDNALLLPKYVAIIRNCSDPRAIARTVNIQDLALDDLLASNIIQIYFNPVSVAKALGILKQADLLSADSDYIPLIIRSCAPIPIAKILALLKTAGLLSTACVDIIKKHYIAPRTVKALNILQAADCLTADNVMAVIRDLQHPLALALVKLDIFKLATSDHIAAVIASTDPLCCVEKLRDKQVVLSASSIHTHGLHSSEKKQITPLAKGLLEFNEDSMPYMRTDARPSA